MNNLEQELFLTKVCLEKIKNLIYISQNIDLEFFGFLIKRYNEFE